MTGDGKADLGVVGLAVMGANLARNAARRGFGVALFNRHSARTDALMRDHGDEGRFYPASSLGEFVAALSQPRIVIVMVKAGKPVDEMIDELLPLLDRGDILIDAGNSLFSDSARRTEFLCGKGVEFVGMGVSGGEQGALEGPSMMPGCEPAAYARIAPFLTRMAAQAAGRPCCARIGSGGAGHYVKMAHNGIEYADMQLIAEAYDILTSVYGLSAAAIGDVFAAWNATELESYLIEITAIVLRQRDATGGALVDAILDEAEQKGTGAGRRSRRSTSACPSPRSPRRSTPARSRPVAICAASPAKRIRAARMRRSRRPRPTSKRYGARSTPRRSSLTLRASR